MYISSLCIQTNLNPFDQKHTRFKGYSPFFIHTLSFPPPPPSLLLTKFSEEVLKNGIPAGDRTEDKISIREVKENQIYVYQHIFLTAFFRLRMYCHLALIAYDATNRMNPSIDRDNFPVVFQSNVLIPCIFFRLTVACQKKCISPKYKEGDLTKGESVCLDRCVAKYLEIHDRIGKKLTAMSMQDEKLMSQLQGQGQSSQ